MNGVERIHNADTNQHGVLFSYFPHSVFFVDTLQKITSMICATI